MTSKYVQYLSDRSTSKSLEHTDNKKRRGHGQYHRHSETIRGEIIKSHANRNREQNMKVKSKLHATYLQFTKQYVKGEPVTVFTRNLQ